MAILRFLAMMLLVVSPRGGTHGVRVRTVDASGAPFPNVLVIIRSLEGKGEIGRYLTDPSGRTPPIQMDGGLYRLITTCPYGVCQTAIHEFLGSNVPSEIVSTIYVNPSDLNGEIVGAPRVRLALLDSAGRPEVGAHVLVRDEAAKWERWYVTDRKGSATVELLADPSVLVVVYDNKLVSEEVGVTCGSAKIASHPAEQCRTINPSQTVTLHLGHR